MRIVRDLADRIHVLDCRRTIVHQGADQRLPSFFP
jgi:hypothetical protein